MTDTNTTTDGACGTIDNGNLPTDFTTTGTGGMTARTTSSDQGNAATHELTITTDGTAGTTRPLPIDTASTGTGK